MEYLKHTLSHIAGALAVLVIAVLVGYVARAQTTQDTGSSTGSVIAMPVYFSASKIGETCIGGITHHQYAFSITPVSGGYIRLDSAIFIDDLNGNFQQMIGPGSHTWAGYARSGYALASGSQSGGAISVPSVSCAADTTTSTTNTSSGDTVSPSTPTGVMAAGVTGGGIKIAWNTATDNVGVTMYVVYRNGSAITETTITNFHDVGVTPGSTYSYTVAAVDAARNVSPQSAAAMATAPTVLTADTTTTATKYVSLFTVQPSQSTECVNGTPMTHVGFFFETGAYVTVTRNLGNGFTAYEAGDRILPNDTYRWVGKARTDLGYALASGGVYEGTFTLSAACPTSTETAFDSQSSTTAPASSTTFGSEANFVAGLPMLGLVMDPNTTYETRVFPYGIVQGSRARILVATPFRAERVDVFLGREGTSISLGTAFSVGPLLDGTYYGYAKDWDTTQNQDGEYAILARAYKTSTDIVPTDTFLVYVRNSSTATVSIATTTIVETTTTATDTGTVTTTTTTTTGGTATTQTTSSTESTATVPKVTTTTTPSAPTAVSPKPAPTPIPATTSDISLSAPETPPIDVIRVCGTRESCQTFCEENPDRIAECRDFARTAIIAELPRGSQIRSIAETLPEEVRQSVSVLLAETATRPAGIPEEVRDTHTFAQFCSDPDHEALCGRVLIDNRVLSEEEFSARVAEVEIARNEQRKILSERVGTRAYTDSDGDGVTDYDEINLYGTDPRDVDTDNDGIRDGDEIMAGTNPAAALAVAATGTSVMATGSMQTTPGTLSPEEMRFENPRLAGVKTPELLAVQKVDVAEKETLPDGTERVKSLALAGQAPPNSFVRIFVFSEPIMVTVRAGDDGIWTYTFDKELSNGQHEVYTAITDVSGKIVAKSSPTAFVKTANAVSIVPAETLLAATPAPEAASPSFFSGTSLYALIAVGIGIVGIAISVIGFAVRRKDDVDIGGPTALPPASA